MREQKSTEIVPNNIEMGVRGRVISENVVYSRFVSTVLARIVEIQSSLFLSIRQESVMWKLVLVAAGLAFAIF